MSDKPVRAHEDDYCDATNDCVTREDIRRLVGNGCELLFVGKHPFGSGKPYELYATQQLHMLSLVAFARDDDGHWKEDHAIGLPRDVRTVERMLHFAKTYLDSCADGGHDHRNAAPGKP
jgi:hypothetical protein